MPRIRVSSLFPVDLAGARVAELADALDLGSSVFDVWVRVPSRAQLPVPGRPEEAAVDRLRS